MKNSNVGKGQKALKKSILDKIEKAYWCPIKDFSLFSLPARFLSCKDQ
jgi:hypothetical protein